MALLSQAERASIEAIIRSLRVGSAGKFLDATSVEQLTRIFRDKCEFICCGNASGVNFLNGMRDEPWRTVLTALLCADASLAALTPEQLAADLAALTPAELAALLAALCPPPADLGTAEDYGVIGATQVTNTGATVVDGNLAVSPSGTLVGFGPGVVLGETHLADAEAAQAQADSLAAYNALVLLGPGTIIAGDIGGTTLAPGVYSSATTLGITGSVFLDAGGDPCATWVINVGSALTTAASSKVVLLNGAQSKNVFWTMGTSATLGTDSVFRGTLIADASITETTTGFVEGRLIALNGQVTLDTNIIELPV